MVKLILRSTLLACVLLLTACIASVNTTSSNNTPGYEHGFHDGRHSGLGEGGVKGERYIKDYEQWANNPHYRSGWIEGEKEGKRIAAQEPPG